MNNKSEESASTAGLFSWALYDWANSSFFAVIQTFVFATFFIQSVAENDVIGSNQWGNVISAAGLLIALVGPFLGAIADQMGRRKPWIFFFSMICILATAGLWFVGPSNDFLMLALILIFISTVGSECAIIFYNAMLPNLVSGKKMGRWSGWAWGLGYAGGLVCMVVALFLFINVEQPPFGLDKAAAEHVRATFLLVAIWYLIFSIPLFLKTPDEPRSGMAIREAVKNGWKQLKESIRHIREYKDIMRFLIARMIFIDGLATVFAFGGIYAAGTFDMNDLRNRPEPDCGPGRSSVCLDRRLSGQPTDYFNFLDRPDNYYLCGAAGYLIVLVLGIRIDAGHFCRTGSGCQPDVYGEDCAGRAS